MGPESFAAFGVAGYEDELMGEVLAADGVWYGKGYYHTYWHCGSAVRCRQHVLSRKPHVSVKVASLSAILT